MFNKTKISVMNETTLNYSKSEIIRNFRIKVYGVDGEGNRINKLVGVSGIIALIGVDFVNKFVEKAFNCMEDVFVCKLRRGIKISFYCK